jgi:glycosyltransferase involved in cell wall biosynthesis
VKKIYIDGLALVEGHFSGVGQYILGILQGLDQILDELKYSGMPTPEIIVIIPYDSLERFLSFGFKHVGYKKFPLPFRYMAGLWHRGWLPPIDLWCGRGNYIFTRFVDMPLVFSKSGLVVFDLSFELHKEYSEERNARFLAKFVRKSVKRSSKVFTISRSVESEVKDLYGLADSGQEVAFPATNPQLFYRRSKSEVEAAKEKYGIDGEYILALSNLEPRKNLDTLVKAYCVLPEKIRHKYSLLLVGVSGWKTETLFGEITARVQAGYNIIRPSRYVSDKDKPAIISGAKMLVYPSHYEGFGMPPLEALACGVPVICADNSSLPEAVGKAARLVPSNDLEGLAKAMEDYLNDYERVSGEALVEGPKQARKFSWVESARVYYDWAINN